MTFAKLSGTTSGTGHEHMSEELGVPALPVETGARPPKNPKLLVSALLGLILLAGCAVGGVWMYNETTLQKPLQRVLIADPRNHVVFAPVTCQQHGPGTGSI